MPSLRKLAELAGVSPSTVTRALRGDSRISLETRTRIQALARECHYLPNRLAQSVMSGISNTLGLVLPSVVTPYSARLLSGVLHAATAAGYRVLIRESFYQLSTSLSVIQMFIEQRVDGILLDCGHLASIPRTTILAMRSHGILPVGLDATQCVDAIDHVHTDEEAMTTEAVDYLLHLGHQRIAFVGHTVGGALVGRGEFIHRAFRRRGLSTRYFVPVDDTPPYERLPVADMLVRVMSMEPSPTALIAWEDPLAALFLKAAMRLGMHVPGDFSLLGFGNLPIANLLSPMLTTFEQHPEIVGQRAVELFLARLHDEHAARRTPPRVTTIAPTLIKRESCAPFWRHQ